MNTDNLRISVCEHTQKEVVQQKFGEEWVCLHEETEEEDLRSVEEFKKQLQTN